MSRILDETMIIESIDDKSVNLYGVNGIIATIDVNAEDMMHRMARHYGTDVEVGKYWVAKTLKIRKNVPVNLCSKVNALFFNVNCKETNLPIWFRYMPMMKYKSSPDDGGSIYIGNKKILKVTFSRFQYKTQIKRSEEFKKISHNCAICPVIKCKKC